MTWRLLTDGRSSPARNMAIDEAILRQVEEPVLRIYGWSVPALSLGYFQTWTLAAGRPFVRRFTGGGLVDHAQDVTYTVVVPREHPLLSIPTTESYAKIHAAVRLAIAEVGWAAELTPSCTDMDSAACFQKAVKYDVTWNGQKLAGAAQRRTREGMLQQGSILLPDPARNEALKARLPDIFAQELGIAIRASKLTETESRQADELELSRYGTDDWNKHR